MRAIEHTSGMFFPYLVTVLDCLQSIYVSCDSQRILQRLGRERIVTNHSLFIAQRLPNVREGLATMRAGIGADSLMSRNT
jgi:hypothetical protein